MPDKTILLERHAFEFQLKGVQLGKHEAARFSGIASVFGSIVDTSARLGARTRIQPGAFTRTLAHREKRVKILDAHNAEKAPIGIPISLRETEKGLEFVASLNRTRAGLDWAEALKHMQELGDQRGELSIGFDVIREDYNEDPDTGEIFRDVLELRLFEISCTPFGADESTAVYEAASLANLLAAEQPIDKMRERWERERERGLREIAKHEEEMRVRGQWIEEYQQEEQTISYYSYGSRRYE